MKYAIIIGDGMADWKVPSLGMRTPLEAAVIPHGDFMARSGLCGMVQVVSKNLYPGSDVSNLSILGYDPEIYYTGRSPLEAASIGVDLDDDDVAVRCNIVTVDGGIPAGKMVDYSAGHASSDEARALLADLNISLSSRGISFYPGVSYRNLMVWKEGIDSVKTTPPHDIMGKEVLEFLPEGEGANFLREIMTESEEIMADHPVNRKRRKEGKLPASSIWLWGQGKAPRMPSFKDTFGMEGSVIAAVDLLRGIGKYLGMEIIDVPGATGYVDTNFEGKGKACLKELERKDFVVLHVEAPDEAGHNGDGPTKVHCIEEIDRFVIGPLLSIIRGGADLRILFLPDHPTPIEIRTHANEPVPFLIYPAPGVHGKEYTPPSGYTEEEASRTGVIVEKGTNLITLLLGR